MVWLRRCQELFGQAGRTFRFDFSENGAGGFALEQPQHFRGFPVRHPLQTRSGLFRRHRLINFCQLGLVDVAWTGPVLRIHGFLAFTRRLGLCRRLVALFFRLNQLFVTGDDLFQFCLQFQKMGFALARAAREAGAEVHLVAGPVALPTPRGVLRTDVGTAQQMLDAVQASVPGSDVFVAVAAVADWRVDGVADQKLKKAGDSDVPSLSFVQNPDILATVARLPNPPYCVGFAAESEQLETFGEAKRQRKNIPLLAGNLGPSTFGRDDNEIILFDAQGMTRLPRADKLALARQLVAAIAARLPG